MLVALNGLAELLEELAHDGGATKDLNKKLQNTNEHCDADGSPNDSAEAREDATDKRAPDLAAGAVQDVDVV